MTIGERIKSLRKAKGKSQEDLALDLGVSRQTINKWEANKVKPTTQNIKMLCSIFEISSDYFFISEVNQTELEVAASKDSADDNKSKRKVLILCSILLGILFLISAIMSVVFGFVVFSPNTGDKVVSTDGVEIVAFSTALIVAIITFIAEVIIFTKVNKS